VLAAAIAAWTDTRDVRSRQVSAHDGVETAVEVDHILIAGTLMQAVTFCVMRRAERSALLPGGECAMCGAGFGSREARPTANARAQ
jgi:hypothetical protein